MKTNQILTRKMDKFEVIQRTKDGMFNATSLLKQWNNCSNIKKDIDDYLKNESTKEFVTALISEENLDTQKNGYDGSDCKLAYYRSRANKGDNAGTWMHPIMFIDFCMWLNPTFKVKVLKFVSDEMLKYRNDAGDAYREMCTSVAKLVEKTFIQTAIKDVAKALNYIVYNNHEPMMRNKNADESLLREMVELEKDIVKLIHFGFVKSFDGLKEYLRVRWREKWQPKVLTA